MKMTGLLVVLSDAGGESNASHEFYLVMVNPNDETLGFSLDYSQTGSAIDTGGGSEEEPLEPPQMPTAPAASKVNAQRFPRSVSDCVSH